MRFIVGAIDFFASSITRSVSRSVKRSVAGFFAVLTTVVFAVVPTFVFTIAATFVLTVAAPEAANAEEKIGTFAIENIRLRPTYNSAESSGGQFAMADSAFSLRWSKANSLSAVVEVGPLAARYKPIYVDPATEAGYGFTQAYAEYSGIYGRVRFGLIPTNYGYDGSVNSNLRLFSPGQLIQNRLVAYDDNGISFFTQHNGYFTELIVHNGEIENSNEGRLWATSNFGWTNNRDWRTQLSLSTGTVNGTASTAATTTIAGVKNAETAKWRHADFFANWSVRDWNVVLEAAGGQVEQSDHSGGYAFDRVEISRFFSKNFGSGLRYDYFDPDTNIGKNAMTNIGLMLAIRSDDATSTLAIVGTKVLEEGHQVNNDQIMVSWLLTPYTR